MQLIFDSRNYCVVEFPLPGEDLTAAGGYEIVHKHLKREIFLRGRDAEQFRRSVRRLIAQEPSADDVDDFLDGYAGLLTTPIALH